MTPARSDVGEVVEAGTVLGHLAKGDEAVVGNAHGGLPHLHFVVDEERPDGRLEGILRRHVHVAADHLRHRRHAS